MENQNLKIANDFAGDYDKVVPSNGWHCPEILFGLSYELLKPGSKVLDLGVGTGLSSVLFKKAGQVIYGLDGSIEMAKICESKNILTDIRIHDLKVLPYPYKSVMFNHVFSCGVFHLVGELDGLMSEVSRMICQAGIFGFTVDEFGKDDQNRDEVVARSGIEETVNKNSGVRSYKHDDSYIQ
ncbi:MAG: class I SAM-dependent methyltransferase, partial [Proteobacteria bacterium]|nr:class I SAM-dependent methyltransferase [Pseudomonadota bacterium]